MKINITEFTINNTRPYPKLMVYPNSTRIWLMLRSGYGIHLGVNGAVDIAEAKGIQMDGLVDFEGSITLQNS